MKSSKVLKILGWNIMILFLLLEVTSMAYMKLAKPNLGYLARFPTYLEFSYEDQLIESHDPLGPHFIDTAYPWATWHPKNSLFRHKKPCFDVIMRFNSLGTRGAIPNAADTNNVFFIGDSFTEGYGLPEDSTLPALVSRKMSLPVLNLGSSGYVGTTQFGLIYEHFSKLFRHREVYVLLFLQNDIMENRIPEPGASEPETYRPYRTDTGNLGKISYTGSLENNPYSWESYRKNILPGNMKLSRIGIKTLMDNPKIGIVSKLLSLTYTKRMVLAMQKDFKSRSKGSPGDIQYSRIDLKILEYDLKFIADIAKRSGAMVTFINLPDVSLLNRTLKKPGSDTEYLELERHIATMFDSGPHRFISFYRHLIDLGINPKSIVFECDNHYNRIGMELLADFISQNRR